MEKKINGLNGYDMHSVNTALDLLKAKGNTEQKEYVWKALHDDLNADWRKKQVLQQELKAKAKQELGA